DPHLPAAPHVTGHGHTGRLNLIAGDPPGTQGLQAELTVLQGVAPMRDAPAPPPEMLAVLDLAGYQHPTPPPVARPPASCAPAALHPCRSRPSRRSGRRWCGLRRSHSPRRPAASAGGWSPPATIRCGRFPPHPADPTPSPSSLPR